jgi:hypothetical protein
MIKELIVSIFCLLLITAGFSFCVPAEQDKTIIISESELLDSEAVAYEVSPGNDDIDSISSISSLDTLDQQQTQDCNYSFAITGNDCFAQSFIPTLEQLTKVELKLYKKGTPEDLKISIRSNLTGLDLTSILLSATLIPTNKTWYECDFPDLSVTPGTTYYIVWDPRGVPDCYNNSYWCFGINNSYVNGSIFRYYIDFGIWYIFNPINFSNPDFCFKTYGLPAENNPPNQPSTPVGETNGKINVEYTYSSDSTDPDGNQVYYLWDWGDGNTSGWLGPYDSGFTLITSHTWTDKGSYTIKIKAKDTSDAESPWSEPLPITMPTVASWFGGITSPMPGYLYLFGDQLFLLKSGKTIILFGGILVAANFTTEGAPMKTVQFYLDDVLMNEDTTAPYSVTLSTKHKGPANIKVTAIDILGRSASDTLYIDNYLKLA